MFYQLPPVGNPICLTANRGAGSSAQLFGAGYQSRYYASGTAALAVATSTAIQLKKVDEPEVLLPAYGCPDLISAVLFAGAKPILVDLATDRPWMDLEQLPSKLSPNTVAIIAVNFCGISERMEQLRPFAKQAGALLIEDSAQAFPSKSEGDIWQGDLVVLSFGRGKPVSLLGGCALLYNRKKLGDRNFTSMLPDEMTQVDAGLQGQIAFRLKARLYNWVINPRIYWLLHKLPFLHLGETRYKPLHSIDEMACAIQQMLPANIEFYQNDSMERQDKICEVLDRFNLENSEIIDLPRLCGNTKERRLLRYPLLIEKKRRERLYSELQQHGLGASRMYPAVLPEIAGLGKVLQQEEFPRAKSFAERILTFPTHAHVSGADIDKISQVLSGELLK